MSDLPQTQEEKPSVASRMLNTLAYPISILVGGFYASGHVRNASYDGLRKIDNGKNKASGAFYEEYEIRNNAVRDLFEKRQRNEISAEEFAGARHAADTVYSKAVEVTHGKLGYSSVWKRFHHLDWNQKLQTTMTFATAAGVTLGVLLTIANNKNLLDRIANIGRRRDDQPPAK